MIDYESYTNFLKRQYEYGFINEDQYKKKLDLAKEKIKPQEKTATADQQERGTEMKPEDKNETKKKKSKSEYTEQEYIDLILNFMQMTFKGTIKGFEVKNTANGKLKIVIK